MLRASHNYQRQQKDREKDNTKKNLALLHNSLKSHYARLTAGISIAPPVAKRQHRRLSVHMHTWECLCDLSLTNSLIFSHTSHTNLWRRPILREHTSVDINTVQRNCNYGKWVQCCAGSKPHWQTRLSIHFQYVVTVLAITDVQMFVGYTYVVPSSHVFENTKSSTLPVYRKLCSTQVRTA